MLNIYCISLFLNSLLNLIDSSFCMWNWYKLISQLYFQMLQVSQRSSKTIKTCKNWFFIFASVCYSKSQSNKLSKYAMSGTRAAWSLSNVAQNSFSVNSLWQNLEKVCKLCVNHSTSTQARITPNIFDPIVTDAKNMDIKLNSQRDY